MFIIEARVQTLKKGGVKFRYFAEGLCEKLHEFEIIYPQKGAWGVLIGRNIVCTSQEK